MDCLNLTELGILPLFRHPKHRKGSYEHKNQVEFYKNVGRGESCASREEDTEEMHAMSEHFRKRYRFQPKTVEALALLIEGRLKPKARTNHAFTVMQKLCIALRFYATGTHQMEVGDGEGASQASCSRIIKEVSAALADQAEQLGVFSLDPEILATVATGFYGFNGSKFNKNVTRSMHFRWNSRVKKFVSEVLKTFCLQSYLIVLGQ